jgi:putative phosphoesterase
MVQRHENILIDIPGIERGLIAVISDTHGKPHASLFPILEQYGPSLILDAGDLGAPALLSDLNKVSPTVFVRGNIDPVCPTCPDSVSLRITMGGTFSMDLLLLHIAIARMRLNRDTLDLLRQHPAQGVVFGHSHIPFVGEEDGIWLFNPGSAGPARMGLPTTIGLIELSSGKVSFRHIDLLTGKEWIPEASVRMKHA